MLQKHSSSFGIFTCILIPRVSFSFLFFPFIFLLLFNSCWYPGTLSWRRMTKPRAAGYTEPGRLHMRYVFCG